LIIGGVKIFEGAILGAFLIGILQSIVIWKLSARWVDAFVFLLFIIFLLFKPTGLLGKKLRVEEIR
jgi:branched-chain amino acid transport system permease protein